MNEIIRAVKVMCDADKRHELTDLYGQATLKEVVPTVGNVLKNIDVLEESNV